MPNCQLQSAVLNDSSKGSVIFFRSVHKINTADRLYNTVMLNSDLLCFGTTQFWYGKTPESFACMLEAVRTYGIRKIDTAEMYGNGTCEEAVGDLIAQTGRDQLYIIDKILPYNVSAAQMRRSLENSLKRLRTDYIDMYLLHWRENADLELTAEMMERFRQEGKIREWGVSNFDVNDLEDLKEVRYGDRCSANQVYFSLDKRGVQFDLLPFMKENSIHAMAYSSLDERSVRQRLSAISEISKILAEENISIERLMLEYVQYHGVCALFQTRSRNHLRDDLAGDHFDIEKYIDLISAILPAPDFKVPLEKR